MEFLVVPSQLLYNFSLSRQHKNSPIPFFPVSLCSDLPRYCLTAVIVLCKRTCTAQLGAMGRKQARGIALRLHSKFHPHRHSKVVHRRSDCCPRWGKVLFLFSPWQRGRKPIGRSCSVKFERERPPGTAHCAVHPINRLAPRFFTLPVFSLFHAVPERLNIPSLNNPPPSRGLHGDVCFYNCLVCTLLVLSLRSSIDSDPILIRRQKCLICVGRRREYFT